MNKFLTSYLNNVCNQNNITLFGKSYKIIKVATTQEDLKTGLMGVTNLACDECVLFKFPDTAVRNFWMKNCFIPLTVIFLDETFNPVSVKHMDVQLQRKNETSLNYNKRLVKYSSDYPIKYAVEIFQDRSISFNTF